MGLKLLSAALAAISLSLVCVHTASAAGGCGIGFHRGPYGASAKTAWRLLCRHALGWTKIAREDGDIGPVRAGCAEDGLTPLPCGLTPREQAANVVVHDLRIIRLWHPDLARIILLHFRRHEALCQPTVPLDRDASREPISPVRSHRSRPAFQCR